ncbi:unnamed protein product, partial [Staurois parvus]
CLYLTLGVLFLSRISGIVPPTDTKGGAPLPPLTPSAPHWSTDTMMSTGHRTAPPTDTKMMEHCSSH